MVHHFLSLSKDQATKLLFGLIASLVVFNIVWLLQLSIRLDEAQTIWVASKSLSQILLITAQDVHVPLYSLLAHLWLIVFGNNILTLRLLSVFFFLITLPMLFQLTRDLSSSRQAWLTVILFSASPFIIWFSSEARMYTLFVFVTTFHHWRYLRLLESQGRQGKFWYLVSGILGVFTHYFFWLVLVSQVLYTMVVSWSGREGGTWLEQVKFTWNKWQTNHFYLTYVKLLILIGVSFLPWIVFVISQGSISNTRPLIPPPTTFNLIQLFTQFIFGFQQLQWQSIFVSLWPLMILAIFLFFTKKRQVPLNRKSYLIMASFLPVALVFVVSFIRPIFLSRYLILIMPTFFIFFTWIVESSARRNAIVATSMVALVMLSSTLYQSLSRQTPVKENYEAVSDYLMANTTAHDIIAVSAPFTIYPIEYTYKGPARIDTIPAWSRYSDNTIPQFTYEDLSKQLQEYQSRYHRLFVVLSYDQGYESDIRQMLDKSYAYEDHLIYSDGLEIREYILRYDGIFAQPASTPSALAEP